MNLPVPVPGEESGPQWSFDLNSCMTIIDGHNHSAGSGVQINPAGININSDLPFLNNNAVSLRSSRYQVQGSLLNLATDIGCLYVSGLDLYYNDISGNQVRITQSGGVAGSPGSISNLTSPASAAYVAGNETFVWQSDANTAANMDAGSYIFRNITANSNGITVSAPSSLASNYALTWPAALPASQKFMTMDNSGNIAAPWTTDNTTIQIASNQLSVIVSGVTPTASLRMSASSTVSAGWLLCDGTGVSRTTYSALYAEIGDSCGHGDGSTTFNLPDYRGQFLRMVSGASGRDPDASSRTAMNTGGNTGNNVGSVQAGQYASHTHTQNAHGHTNTVNDPTHSHTTGGSTGQGSSSRGYVDTTGYTSHTAGDAAATGITVTIDNTTASNQNSGGNETRPTNAYVYVFIKT